MSVRAALAAAAIALLGAMPAATQLPLEPTKESGQGVTAAYEGWFKTADGGAYLLVGYFNRNTKQTLDIPIGPDNRIEPGGPDMGQPTYFLPRRQWGVFTIKVPADFGDRKLTWTLTANGHTTAIPLGLNPLYEVEPYKDAAQGNTPPSLRFEAGGAAFQGPPRAVAATLTASAGQPLPLTLWATDDAIVDPDRKAGESPVMIKWSKYRGPGEVTFTDAQPKVDTADGRTMTTATFSAPGAYVLRAQANDVSGEGGGGFQCCWTNAHVAVTVKPGS
jgi:hypothetical protein